MAKSRALAERPVTAEVLMPEQSLTISEGSRVTAFFKNAAEFFSVARKLETDAMQRLATARAFRMPTDAQADAELQVFIRDCSKAKKAVVAHWEITSLIHGLHKRLVAARKRAEDACEEAANTAQRLHNQYVEQERRRVQEEERRRREEEMRKAEEARQRELAALEAQALEAEAARDDLSEREKRFVDYVFQMVPHIVAARQAGYRNPEDAAARLMKTRKIEMALQAKRDAAAMRQQAQAIAAKPVEITDTRVEMNVLKVGTDRTSWSAEVYDGVALRAAAIEDEMLRRAGQKPKYGIPIDVLMVNPVVCNDYARSMHEALDVWPGVRSVKKTKTV